MYTTNGSLHNTYRKNAIIAGVLFIIGTASGVLSVILCSSIWNAPDYLVRLSANANLIRLGIILQFLMAIACAGISLALYPILKRFNAGLAIGAAGFRLIENMLQILKAVSMITLLALSQEFIRAGSPATSYFQGAGEIIRTASDWMINGPALICFAIGASMYYIVFYQHSLMPRWLSGWGLVSLVLVMITSMLVMTGIIPAFGIIQVTANLSILVQEMVFAVWLIVKGFNPSQVASVSLQPAMS
jgi:Domain of unknown function (DUF4386)